MAPRASRAVSLSNARAFVEAAGAWIDFADVCVIVVGALIASIAFVRRWRGSDIADAYVSYRHNSGRAISWA